jgi:hypothetical protein
MRTMTKVFVPVLAVLLITSYAVAERCTATTNIGSRCRRNSQQPSQYCWEHRLTYGDSETKPTPKPAKKKSRRREFRLDGVAAFPRTARSSASTTATRSRSNRAAKNTSAACSASTPPNGPMRACSAIWKRCRASRRPRGGPSFAMRTSPIGSGQTSRSGTEGKPPMR